MFSKSFVSFVILAVLSSGVQARMRIVERDGRALYGRRFGQESNPITQQIGSACRGEVCGVIGGKAVGTLLAGAGECAQQDLADDLIDAAGKEDAATAAKMIDLAIKFRQAEKNTPPDFTKNPPAARNSVFCQTQPRNSQLVGLNQAQDPANDPTLFFDPATKSTVLKGSQANTSPLGGGNTSPGKAADVSSSVAPASTASATAIASATDVASATSTDASTPTDVSATCPAVPTVTVTVDAAATPTATGVVSSTDAAATATSAAATATATDAAAAPAATGALPAGVDLGTCTDPSIKFGAGIDNRKETSFIPNNTKEFAHSSAQASGIITQFICDTFINSCKANAAAVSLCKEAQAAAVAAGAKKGDAADAFNAKFGIKTNFASVTPLDNQGKAATGL